MKKSRFVASLATAATIAFVASPAMATPTMPEGQTLFTIEHMDGGRLGFIDADGVATPIGEGDPEVTDVRDADYDWDHNIAYVLADGGAYENTCDVWTVDLATGEYSLAWSVYDQNDDPMYYCDALMVSGVDSSEIWVSGQDNSSNPETFIYDRITGDYLDVTPDNSMWQAMDQYAADNVTTYYYNDDDAGGRFYNALDSNAVWISGYDNMQSISYTQEGDLWYINWNELVEIGQVDPATGTVDVLTDDLTIANGDQWGTDAIFWAPAISEASQSGAGGLASTGVDGTNIALGGFGLMALGAVVAIRRRATR